MRCRHSLVAFFLALFSARAFAQQPGRLLEGQPFTVRGTLVMVPSGRLQFAAVRTSAAYVRVVAGQDLKLTNEIGLSGYNRYDLLFAHRGQTVMVAGAVMLDDASPYYLHGVLLKVNSVRLADGTELVGRPRPETSIAVDVGQYKASVLLSADLSAPWRYSAHGQADPEHQFLSCSSNGGGDVVNCFCAKGFRALAAESSARNVDAKVFQDSHTAQFGVGDHPRQLELSVTCSR